VKPTRKSVQITRSMSKSHSCVLLRGFSEVWIDFELFLEFQIAWVLKIILKNGKFLKIP
jgi:hypothetical protein